MKNPNTDMTCQSDFVLKLAVIKSRHGCDSSIELCKHITASVLKHEKVANAFVHNTFLYVRLKEGATL